MEIIYGNEDCGEEVSTLLPRTSFSEPHLQFIMTICWFKKHLYPLEKKWRAATLNN